jgi:hypothetical protein
MSSVFDQPGQRMQQTGRRRVSGRHAMMKAWLNLNGAATPDGAHPTGRRVSVVRTKIIGAAFTLTGLATAYFFIFLPIEEAKRNGVLRQSPFGLLLPIALLYWGVMILVTDLRDEKTMRVAAEGRLHWTRKGLVIRYGMWITIVVTLIAWYMYVRFIRVAPF